MNKYYDKEEFARLVSLAVGNIHKKEFAKLIGLTPEYFSRIINGKMTNPPSIGKIQEIAKHASNDITYSQLLVAAGYVSPLTDSTIEMPDELTDTMKKYMSGTILTALASFAVPYTIEQTKEDTNYHVSVSFSSGSFTHWYFTFLNNSNVMQMKHQLNSHYIRLIYEELSKTDKISFVTTDKQEFDLYLDNMPRNLDLNLSIILIDEKTLSVQKECWLHSTSSISEQDISIYTL